MLWSKQYKVDLLLRNASQSIAAPNWWTVYFGLDVCQDKKKKKIAKCISFPISQPSVHTAQSSTHLMPLNFLEWIPFKSVPNRTDQRRNYFCKAVSEKSLPCCLTVGALTVDRVRRPTEMQHGILYLKCTSVIPVQWPCAAIEQATLSSPSTNKTLYQNSKNKPNKKNTPMWESSLSQASFHSLFEVTLNCRWQRWKAWHSTVQRGKGVGKEGLFPEKNH